MLKYVLDARKAQRAIETETMNRPVYLLFFFLHFMLKMLHQNGIFAFIYDMSLGEVIDSFWIFFY